MKSFTAKDAKDAKVGSSKTVVSGDLSGSHGLHFIEFDL
jgi:hypothetical protein